MKSHSLGSVTARCTTNIRASLLHKACERTVCTHVEQLKSIVRLTYPNINNAAFIVPPPPSNVRLQFLGLSTGSRATRSAAALRSAVTSCLQTGLVVIRRKGACSLHGRPVQRERTRRTNRCVKRGGETRADSRCVRGDWPPAYLPSCSLSLIGFYFFWWCLNRTIVHLRKQITLILVSRATAQTARCPPLQNPAPPVAAEPHHTPRPTLALTFLTRRSFVTLTPRTRRKPRRASPRSTRPSSIHPHPDAIPPSRSWCPKRTTTARTPPVPWRH